MGAGMTTAENLLIEFESVLARGSQAYSEALFEAGRIASEYVQARLQLNGCMRERAAAIKALADVLNKTGIGGESVEPSDLIRAYQVRRLLGGDLPHHFYESIWSRVIKRQDVNSGQEHWDFREGKEEECREAFRAACEKKADRYESMAIVDKLTGKERTYRNRPAAETRKPSAPLPMSPKGCVRDTAEMMAGVIEKNDDPLVLFVTLCRELVKRQSKVSALARTVLEHAEAKRMRA